VVILSLIDHYLQLSMIGAADEPMVEGYTSLGFLAAHNATTELQLLVTGVTYRHPRLLAKIDSTLDVLSDGCFSDWVPGGYERQHAAVSRSMSQPKRATTAG
jgi:hypothetical protein